MNSGIQQLGMEQYLKLQALSSGIINILLQQSPRHAWFDSPLNPDRPESESGVADIGTLAHACLLEGGTSRLACIDPEDYPSKTGGVPKGWTNNAIREARDIARAEGKIPVLLEDVEAVTQMVMAAREFIASSEIKGIFESGKAEQTIIWSEGMGEPNTTFLCKARPDWLSDKILLHFKTTQASVSPNAFSRLAVNSGYDIAMAFYIRGLDTVLPDNEVSHYILAQEQTAPYACKLFDMTPQKADVVRRKVGRAINIWATCLKSGKWPAYDGHVHSIDLMPWEMERALEDGLLEDLGYADPEWKSAR